MGFLVEDGCGGGDGEWQDDGALEREIGRNGADEDFGNGRCRVGNHHVLAPASLVAVAQVYCQLKLLGRT